MKPIDLDYLHDTETRVTDATSGGQKGAKLTQIGALDPVALIELGRIAGMGAQKYAAFNYLKGFDWSLAFNAMQRHAMLFWAGEDRDAESGLSHVAHAAWMALALVSFYLRGLGNDDRPPALDRTLFGKDATDLLERMRSGLGLPQSYAVIKEELDEFWCGAPYWAKDDPLVPPDGRCHRIKNHGALEGIVAHETIWGGMAVSWVDRA